MLKHVEICFPFLGQLHHPHYNIGDISGNDQRIFFKFSVVSLQTSR